MNRATRHHVDRRSVALERLESITAGAAIAGVAGTVAFGTIAGLTFSGTATSPAAPPTDITIDRGGSDDDAITPVQPDTDENANPFLQAAPAPRSATGRGHASTGGSG